MREQLWAAVPMVPTTIYLQLLSKGSFFFSFEMLKCPFTDKLGSLEGSHKKCLFFLLCRLFSFILKLNCRPTWSDNCSIHEDQWNVSGAFCLKLFAVNHQCDDDSSGWKVLRMKPLSHFYLTTWGLQGLRLSNAERRREDVHASHCVHVSTRQRVALRRRPKTVGETGSFRLKHSAFTAEIFARSVFTDFTSVCCGFWNVLYFTSNEGSNLFSRLQTFLN